MNGLPFVFANPWGALALLGLPVVIAIHCLQQKSRILAVSTLFLLERLAPDSKEGRRFTWMRQSIAFWLQILCVLILAWLLTEPRWLQANAVQRVVLVLDSSLSMRAFTGDLVARTLPKLQALSSLAPRTYWTVVETDPSRSTLYEGMDLTTLAQRLGTWSPSFPAHDPTRALELARALAPSDSLVIFVTDRPHDLPNGVDLLAIGEPIENCGLVGSRLVESGNALEWQVMVQNYGTKTAHRSWWIELAGRKTEEQMLDLEPGHPQILKGKFPARLDQLKICLEPDRFPLDDCMYFVRPEPKRLTVDLVGDDATVDLFTRLAQTWPSLSLAQPNQVADVAFITSRPGTPFTGNALSSVILHDDAKAHNVFEGEPFVAEDDPLNQDLNWQGLIFQSIATPKLNPQDRVLLWKDHNPIIFLQSLEGNRRLLVFNFNFSTSNADRLPAFVLLIGRFLDSIRSEKKALETRNTELAEAFTVAADPLGGSVVLRDPTGKEWATPARALETLRAPTIPGFFSITQGKETLLFGAAQFADSRESDFRAATTRDTLAGHHTKLIELHSRAEAITPLWLLLIGVLLVTYWRATSPRLP